MKKELTQIQASDFFGNISMMVKAGMSVQEAVAFYTDEADEKLKAIGKTISEEMDIGFGFWEAADKTGAFSPYTIGAIKAAEYAGRLDEVLEHIGQEYEHKNEMAQRIKNAVTYPAVLLLMMSAVLAVLIFAVLPMFEQVYKNLTGSIVTSSYSYIYVAKVIGEISLVFVVAISIVLLYLSQSFKSEDKRERLYRKLEKLSITESTFYKISLMQFLDTLATLLASGSDTASALELVADEVQHEELKNRIKACAEQVMMGNGMAKSMLETKLLPTVYGRMLLSGEEIGNTDATLQLVSKRIEQEAQEELNSMIDRVEPVLVTILTVFVGMALISVMLPLLGILSAL